MAQYFRLKLSIVNDIIEAAVAVGFIVTPIVLGHNIVNHGVLRVLICYQTVILQGIIICLAFKKPSYLKARRRVYNYIAVGIIFAYSKFMSCNYCLYAARTSYASAGGINICIFVKSL